MNFKNRNEIIIPDTSLCAIIRDEKENPAGGVVDFVECTMPFMEAGIIVDTGSLDGTRELLEEMAFKYSNLKIFDAQFNGYADARNISLKKAQTKYALVLDADERLSREDFDDLKDYMRLYSLEGYNFEIKNILPNGQEEYMRGIHNPRLFRNDLEFEYNTPSKEKFAGEYLYKRESKVKYLLSGKSDTGIQVKHFLPNRNDQDIKTRNWYDFLDSKEYKGKIAPSQIEGFEKWKKKNPLRETYHFGI